MGMPRRFRNPPALRTCPMNDLSRDPIVNAIDNGIRRGIQVAIDNGCYGSAVTLIYAGIDAMAFLGMPGDRKEMGSGMSIDLFVKEMGFA